MSRYLITGGAGFIGSHLAEKLTKDGHQVVILDDFSTGRQENIGNNYQIIRGNITDTSTLEGAFKNIDFCYHLAAVASVQKSIEEWEYSHQINLGGTIAVFLQAAKRHIPVIYASSAAVYGNPELLPIPEDIEIIPTSPYGLDKYCCELQARLFGAIHGLKSVGMRFFNVYGARQDPNSPYSGVMSIFVEKIRNNKALNVFGDGTQERDFVYIDDVIAALIKAQEFTSVTSEVYNVCTGRGVSLNELIQVLFAKLGKEVSVNYLPPRNGDIYKSTGDNSKIKRNWDCNFQQEINCSWL